MVLSGPPPVPVTMRVCKTVIGRAKEMSYIESC